MVSVHACKSSEIKVESAVYHNLVGVDGHPIRVRGSVAVLITVEGRSFQQQFFIADHITAEGILGVDFMERNRCVVDLVKRQITLENYMAIPLASNMPCDSTHMMANDVTIKKTVTIPAESKLEMTVQLPSRSGTWLMEGNQFKFDDVLMVRAVVIPKDNAVPMRITNTSVLPVVLFKGMKVARAELIEDVNINAIIETKTVQLWDQDKVDVQVSLPGELTESQRGKFSGL